MDRGQKAIRITNINLLQDFSGNLQLVLSVDKHLIDKAKLTVQTATERLKQGKEVGVSIAPITKKRSLDANAYFHVLCDRIAEKTQLSMDDVKVNMVVNYGTPKYIVSVPQDAVIGEIWAYTRYVGEMDGLSQYMLYKQTHTLTSAEMSRLIKGTIQEAQQLGIETLTPQELATMEAKWAKKQKGETE